jgi:hypothetical protein
VGSVHEVHVIPKGKLIGPTTLILRADKVQEMNARWTTSKSLSIEYQKARIFQFTNFWQNKEVDNYSYAVDIRLTPISNPLSVESRQ